MQPVVSILMSMRNAAPTVEQTIRSLQWQTLSEWELILFDDGSRDDCSQIVRAFADPRIRLYVDGQSKGLAARLNQGVALATGRFIARVDADDICFPERLRKQIDFLNANPKVDVAACGAAVFTDDGALLGLLPVGLDHKAVTANPFRGFSFPHPTWCGRNEWFRKNPYDSSLSKTQDQDLLLRSYKHSTFASLPDILVGYRQDHLDIRKLLRGRFIFARSIWRHGTGSSAALLGGITMQALKSAFDVGMHVTKLDKFSQRQRLLAVPQAIEGQWSSLWSALNTKSDVRNAADA